MSSEENPEAIDAKSLDQDGEKKPIAKKATKKVAKKATKKVATKKTAKKVTKKVAKKAAKVAKEKAAPEEQIDLKLEAPSEEKPSEEKPKKVAKKATRKTAKKATKKTAKKVAKTSTKVQESKAELTDVEETSAESAAESSAEQNEKQSNHSKPTEQENSRERRESNDSRDNNKRHNNKGRHKGKPKKKEIVLTGDPIEVDGLLELANKGFGFLRKPEKGYSQARDDVFVPPELIRTNYMRSSVWVHGKARMGPKGLQLTEVDKVNDSIPETLKNNPMFEDLKAINPNKWITFETEADKYNTRVLDLVSPVGRGQRGLIVAPPRSGKTTLLMDMAEALIERHEETLYPIILLVDERPEEVTEFKRNLPNVEIFSSSNDSGVRNHCRIAEMCIERSKRLVEEGKHVVVLMDSITRLARAYNRSADSGGPGNRNNKNRGYQSGGIVSGALEVPRRLFAAARNTKEAGSLTILATALVQTNSRADEAIFQEFKGTGNMELVLDRQLADHYIFPAVDIFKSGTRREELLMPEMTLRKFALIRRGLKGHRPSEAMERLLFFLKKFPSNAQMLLEIKG